MKVVINQCYGGFGLSKQAKTRYATLKDIDETTYFVEHSGLGIERTDPVLIQMIEELGKRANGFFAELKIVEIPDDIKWTIEEHDGMERVVEKHRTWK